MEAHPDVIVCGTNAIVVDEDGQALGQTRVPETDAAIRARAGEENPFVHGTVMLRKEAARRLGGYRTEFVRAQDLDLWLRMMELGPVANLGDCLYRCRLRRGRVGARWLREQRAYAGLARRCAAARAAGLPEPPLRVDTNATPVALRVAWAVRGARPDVEYHVHAARILAGSGRRGEARVRLMRAVRRNPASAYAWLSLALGCLPHRLEVGARRFGS
jgi:hypothetical protein